MELLFSHLHFLRKYKTSRSPNMSTSIFLLSFFVVATFSVKHSCRDENGKSVDWYVLYKMPDINENENKLIRKGEAYAYITSEHKGNWDLSKRSIAAEDSIPGLTLAPIYEKGTKRDLLYILYNDQAPGEKGSTSGGAHAKGVVVAGKTGGFWLIHSVPRYAANPSRSKHHEYPESGHNYGQSFLCITLKPEDLEVAGEQLLLNDVNVYAKSVPKQLENIYPNLKDVARKEYKKSPPWNIVKYIVSEGGKRFKVFAKSPQYHKELYSDWVAQDLDTNIIVESWHQEGSSCSRTKHSAESIKEVTVAGTSFKSSKDHSKWTASTTKSKPWVCVGDINKAESQEKRGGGTVCLKDPTVWKAYYDSATKIQRCSKKKPLAEEETPEEEYARYWKSEFWPRANRFQHNSLLVGPLG